ncbi:hypothetical protein [Paenibacillus melissococcoides]|uniref:hypothetical protein n=1 Tax=Paenibacillus melissococcoides TaxID=2912268 RepID=UPI0021C48324|nr:hypothetical protein [Paenibacillus melissococcoides]CAH8721630.1 hypothetical protein HTL2_006458 [Paenibacillus melissococcoides]CAH8721876.1 hypothetical protein HTL2_006580 [Paenibacillus melissococcoides]
MALSQGRNTTEFADGRTLVIPVKGGVKIFDAHSSLSTRTAWPFRGQKQPI